jgi:hypothetical protein
MASLCRGSATKFLCWFRHLQSARALRRLTATHFIAAARFGTREIHSGEVVAKHVTLTELLL